MMMGVLSLIPLEPTGWFQQNITKSRDQINNWISTKFIKIGEQRRKERDNVSAPSRGKGHLREILNLNWRVYMEVRPSKGLTAEKPQTKISS